MLNLHEFSLLETNWKTELEDHSSWLLMSCDPDNQSLTLLLGELEHGIARRIEFLCDGETLFFLSHNTVADMTTAQAYWERRDSSATHILSRLCLEIGEIVVHGSSNEELAHHLRQLSQQCAIVKMAPMIRASVDKSAVLEAWTLSHSTTAVWFSVERFMAWVESQPLEDLLTYLLEPYPRFVLLPTKPEGGPDWILGFGDLDQQAVQSLLGVQHTLAIRQQERRMTLTAISSGPIVVTDWLLTANHAWLFAHRRFALVLAGVVLTSLAHDYRIHNNDIDTVFRLSGQELSLRASFQTDRIADKLGNVLVVTESMVSDWCGFMSYYERTLLEAGRHRRVWTAVMDTAPLVSPITILTDVERYTLAFQALRDKLLDQNLERTLAATDTAHSIVGQLASQMTREVDTIGSEVERLAVTSITSGLVGLGGAVLNSERVATIGPIATALIFLWYFPLMFGRISYLNQSIDRRISDLGRAIRSLKRTAGGMVNEEEHLRQAETHKAFAQERIGKIYSHLTVIFGTLHILTLIVCGTLILRDVWDWATLLALTFVLLYVVHAWFASELTRPLKWFLVVSTVFAACVSLFGLEYQNAWIYSLVSSLIDVVTDFLHGHSIGR